jgi:type VII secretion-associated serine protease mycosin
MIGRAARRALALATVCGLILCWWSTGAVAATQQWHLAFLGVAQAQTISQGEGVIVAVIDSGVDSGHPDLAGSVLPGTDLASPPLSSDGHVDAIGHGTAMAGLIVAHGQALGVAPKAKVLPIRIPGDQAGAAGAPAAISAGIDWAITHHAAVINISAGEPFGGPDEEAAVQRAIASDIVVVAAAGNFPDSTSVILPAAYPGVVAVVGVDHQGNHARMSVSGSQAVLAAPAVDIYSTDIRRNGVYGYNIGDGTSGAAAIVSGVAALVRSKFPSMSAAEVVHRLEATADDKGPPGRDSDYGYGIVDPVKALTANVAPLTPSASAAPVVSPTQIAPATGKPSAAPLLIVALGGFAGALLVVLAVNIRRRLSN